MDHLLSEITILKKKIDALPIMPLEQVDNFHQRYRTFVTYTSNALEWNTLSHWDTSLVINDGCSIAGKRIVELQEAINHAKAYDTMRELSMSLSIQDISIHHICDLHARILQSINDQYAWKRRDVSVRVSGSMTVFPNYATLPVLMDAYIDWLHTCNDEPVMIAIQAHLRFVDIHPFVDGNGRTARLLLNLIMGIYGYPPIIIDPILRTTYISSIDKTRTYEAWSDEYITFMLQSIIDSCNRYLSQRGE
jgi:Fic family protein